MNIKYVLLFMLIAQTALPQCWDYTGKRWLRRGPLQPVECSCNCNREYQSKADRKAARCLNCGHIQVKLDPKDLMYIENEAKEAQLR